MRLRMQLEEDAVKRVKESVREIIGTNNGLSQQVRIESQTKSKNPRSAT